MNALVGYASSDEDEAGDAEAAQVKASPPDQNPFSKVEPYGSYLRLARGSRSDLLQASKTAEALASSPQRPIAGPAYPANTEPDEPAETDDAPALSPHSANRAQIQALTMPRQPNFDIPRSPSPPMQNSEEAADLAAHTRRFERFLELKKQGIHFNDRLESSSALRNPELLQKLLAFAGIGATEQYHNTLGDTLGVPDRWPDGFLEGLVASNEKKLKKERDGRTKLEFVPASSKTRRP